MSGGEIKVDPSVIDDAIAELRTTIEALEASFAKEMEGENKLDMVDAFNEIKKEYEELLTQYKALFLSNVQTTEEAVASLRRMEQNIASEIGNFITQGLNMITK